MSAVEYHTISQCPRIKAIEYYENGKIKRVEFYEGSRVWPAWIVSPWPKPPGTVTCADGSSTYRTISSSGATFSNENSFS